MTTCTYDSGSITGCTPLCDAPASVVIVYRNGSGPANEWPVCDAHKRAAENRAYPGVQYVTRIPAYAEHVHHGMLTYPTPENPGANAWEQVGPGMTDHTGTEYYGVRGMDGREYVAEASAPGAWRIVRRGSYGLGAVTRGSTLKGAVQHLNAFHAGETCVHCGHVNSTREHWCEACRERRYA